MKHFHVPSPHPRLHPCASSSLLLGSCFCPVTPAAITISMGTLLQSVAMHPLGTLSIPVPSALYSEPISGYR